MKYSDKKGIILDKPTTISSVHRWLMKLSDRASDKRGLLDITSELPSRMITPDIVEFVGDWHIERRSIKWLKEILAKL